jgi:uncharacterized protein
MSLLIKPLLPKNRIEAIDVLRGVALFGILLVNILGFNASFFDFGGYYGALPDAFQQSFYNIYISLTADKFIFLFSFLFGYGIWMQVTKFSQESQKFPGFFTRRMLILALFGILHIVLLWAGDILLPYAIAGFVILLLYKLNTRWLIPLALFFYLFIALWLTADVWIPLPNPLSSTCTGCLETARTIYPEGNYIDCLLLRLQEYWAFRNINLIYYLSKVIGIALMGFVASKLDLYQQITTHRKRSTLILIIIAITATAIYFGYEHIVDFESPFANAVYMLGYEVMNLFVAGSYLLFVLLIASFESVGKVLQPIAAMGRMSLTNYLGQSVILAILFYGWGFGLFGQTNVVLLVGMAIAVYGFQMILTMIWLRYHKQGPLEKFWRDFSYKGC